MPIAGVQVQPLPSGHESTLLYFHDANITFESVLVDDIQAGDLKDILDFDFCPSLTFNNFSTSGCQASNQVLDIVNSTVYISKSSFRNANARGLSIINSDTHIFDTVFENLTCPSADQQGGALFIDNYDGGNNVYIQASNFTGNTADGSEGGAIYMKCADCYFEGVRVVKNICGGSGGAILIEQFGGDISFENCLFANNTAGFNGAVYVYPNVRSVDFVNCTFTGNLGYQGGALSFWGVQNVLVDSCNFVENSVQRNSGNPGSGAALYVEGYLPRSTTLYILNSTLSHSHGLDSPGFAAAYVVRCICIGIIDSKFESNLGLGLFIEDAQGDCESSSPPHLPLFNRTTILGYKDDYLDKFNPKSVLGFSLCVDIRRTTFSRNIDSSLLQPLTEAVANSNRGGAALNIRGTDDVVLVEVRFDGNQALQGGGLLLDTTSSVVIWSGEPVSKPYHSALAAFKQLASRFSGVCNQHGHKHHYCCSSFCA